MQSTCNSWFFTTKCGCALRAFIWLLSTEYGGLCIGLSISTFLMYNRNGDLPNECSHRTWDWLLTGGIINIVIGPIIMWLGYITINNEVGDIFNNVLIEGYVYTIWLATIVGVWAICTRFSNDINDLACQAKLNLDYPAVMQLIEVYATLGLISIIIILIAILYNVPRFCRFVIKHTCSRTHTCKCSCVCEQTHNNKQNEGTNENNVELTEIVHA